MPRSLAPVPETPPRAVAYIRVSKERDDMISPELQMTAISDHCARNGYTLTHTIEDLDRTGRFWKRRQVETAVKMIEDGDADILVVWKVSRVSRNRLDWAVAVDRVETAGGRLESATEAVDTSTSTGRFTRGMLAELAAFESERIGESWKETHMRRIASGRPHSGKPKWGYIYNPETKLHEPDPDLAPVLADLYHRYIAGESIHALAIWLNARGYKTIEGNTWRQRILRRTLDSGFAAGRITYNDHETVGIHTHLIDADTWAEYQRQRGIRKGRAPRTERSQYLLSGLVRCACGKPMCAGLSGSDGKPKYRCDDAHERGLPHPQGGRYIQAHIVESAVVDWVREVADDLSAGLPATAARKESQREAQRLSREITKLDGQLTSLTRHLAEGLVPESAYRSAVADINTELDVLHAALGEAEERARQGTVDYRKIAFDLLSHWDLLSVELRREQLRLLVARVVVKAGRVDRTITVVPIWDD
jgi:DNA invertase Pin-like site-specific DNA recombinase